MEIPKRPRGLVPGSIEWFRQVVGPKLLTRLHDEIEAQNVGEMTPTGARLLTTGLSIVYPTVSAVHHTVETQLASMSDAQLKESLAALLTNSADDAQIRSSLERATLEVEYVETLHPSSDEKESTE